MSVIIPVYNEESTLLEVLRRVESAEVLGMDKEIIVVDDKSRDGTRDILRTKEARYKVIYHEKNQGKGSAVRSGLAAATGDVILIQDADLEYDPQDYGKLLKPILDGETEVVFGSRFLEPTNRREKNMLMYFTYQFGNWILTALTNLLLGTRLTDMETCYKMFTRKVLEDISPLFARKFEFEPEVTAKIVKRGYKIREVGIRYYSRDFHEGKKITPVDGLIAAYYLARYRFFK